MSSDKTKALLEQQKLANQELLFTCTNLALLLC